MPGWGWVGGWVGGGHPGFRPHPPSPKPKARVQSSPVTDALLLQPKPSGAMPQNLQVTDVLLLRLKRSSIKPQAHAHFQQSR